MAVATATRISLEVDHDDQVCSQFARPLHEQLRQGYEVCSVMPIPDNYNDWEAVHRTARKRVIRALTRGFYVAQVRREEHLAAIHEVNTSLPKRQGRTMSRSYREFPTYAPLPDYPCPRHGIRTWGVLTNGRNLVGYLTMYRAGELALVSQILGHGDYLEDGIMYLLFATALGYEIGEPGYVVYNRADSGNEGLRFFKTRLGFQPRQVVWAL